MLPCEKVSHEIGILPGNQRNRPGKGRSRLKQTNALRVAADLLEGSTGGMCALVKHRKFKFINLAQRSLSNSILPVFPLVELYCIN